MTHAKRCLTVTLTIILSAAFTCCLWAGNTVTVTPAADFSSRYIWRGIQMNDAPNVQPSLTMTIRGLELGLWGSSTLANNNAGDDYFMISQEIDFWLGYTCTVKNGMALGAVVTDYYFPNAGIRMGNYNNWDDNEGPGAHTIEAGLSLTGPSSFPFVFSAYRNIYNDAGNNCYFQIEYPASINDVHLNFFAGAAGGSKDNPGFYGTAHFNFINLGFTAAKTVNITDRFSLPVFVTYVVNPRVEKGYLLFGFSL